MPMKQFLVAVFCGLLLVSSFGNANARSRRALLPPIVVANIDISDQTMSVHVNGWSEAYWPVSTARSGYHTPRGHFRVQRLARIYFSKKYDNSPMPNAVFFNGGIAIHGTEHVRQLGRPASHGCVRLNPADSAEFYELIENYGASRTVINVRD